MEEESDSSRFIRQLEDEREKKIHAALVDIGKKLEEEEKIEEIQEQQYWLERDIREQQVDILEALHPELDDNGALRAYEHEQIFPMQLTLEELEFRARKARRVHADDQ